MNNLDDMMLKIGLGQTLVVELELSGMGSADQDKIDTCKAKLKKSGFIFEAKTEYSGTNEKGAWRRIMIFARKVLFFDKETESPFA
jgi:hypothetical protein